MIKKDIGLKKKIVRFSNQIRPILDNWKIRENN